MFFLTMFSRLEERSRIKRNIKGMCKRRKTDKNTNLCNNVAFEEVTTLLGVLSIFRQLKPLMKWVCITEINVWLTLVCELQFQWKLTSEPMTFYKDDTLCIRLVFFLKLRKGFQSKGKFKFSIFPNQNSNSKFQCNRFEKEPEENNLKPPRNSFEILISNKIILREKDYY